MYGIDLGGQGPFLWLCHATGQSNLPAIVAGGLKPAGDVAVLAGRVARDFLAVNGRSDLWPEVERQLIERPHPRLSLLNWRPATDDQVYCHAMRRACRYPVPAHRCTSSGSPAAAAALRSGLVRSWIAG